MSLSPRILSIADRVSHKSDYVYDLCCDHGKIGHEVYRRNTHQQIIFVDICSPIINKLKKDTDIPRANFFIKSATEMEFKHTTKTSFIISGVGGLISAKIIENINKQIENTSCEIIVSLNQQLEQFKEHLIKDNVFPLKEYIVVSGNQVYEQFIFNPCLNGENLNIFYNKGLDFHNRQHKEYIEKKYQRYTIKLQNKVDFPASYYDELEFLKSKFNC